MTELPVLDDHRIDEIEDAVFARIAEDRVRQRRRDADAAQARGRRRRTWWGASGAAAAVLVVAALIAPQLGSLTGSSAGSSAAPAADEGWTMRDDAATLEDGATNAESAPAAGDDLELRGAAPEGTFAGREVIATASATVVVTGDLATAADDIAARTAELGGYVESLNVAGAEAASGSEAGMDSAAESSSGVAADGTWMPADPGGTWITVRVPSAALERLVADLTEVGEVSSSRIAREDVTTQAVDLRARVDAASASVERLTALLAESGSLSDLIAAESALAERQAELESLQQQVAYLESQVELSTLTVRLDAARTVVEADPAGFGDGLSAGWSGLVASVNGIVVALGFLLPWLVVLGVAGTIVWLIVRVRRRRAHGRDTSTPDAGGEG